MTPEQNEAFLDDLALLVDGDGAALERWADLLADDDEARDVLHEARRAAQLAKDAGAGFEVPADLEARVLAQIDGAPSVSTLPLGTMAPELPASATEATSSSAAPSSAVPTSAATSSAVPASETPTATPSAASTAATVSAGDARWAPGLSPLPATRVDEPSSVSGATSASGASAVSSTPVSSASASAASSSGAASSGASTAKPRSRAGLYAAAAVALLSVAGAGLIWKMRQGGEAGVTGPDGVPVAATVRVDGLAGDGLVLVAAAGERRLTSGETVEGARIRTDGRTRARLVLGDGSVVTVQQGSELAFAGDRAVELARGEALFDVAHLPTGPNFEITSPMGRVEVLGTKFLVTVDGDQGSVRVLRGEVRVSPTNGAAANLKAGQEALVRADGAHVVNAVDLAGSVAWSELGGEPEDDLPIPGLGELRAHRPGERQEQERPLTLADHRVSVRIVGNVARTEIEETFRNESGETLEGVYRFPMPPDARIASLSLEVEGQWEEGAFVAKDRAAAIWRGVIRNATPESQRQQQEEWIWVPGPWRDPALLEWQQGGRFELRIFPIEARSERRVRIAYEQTLAPHGEGRRYVYPLAHGNDDSTRVGHFEVDVRVAGEAETKTRGYELVREQEEGAQRLRYVREDFQPSGDLVVDFTSPMDRGELRHWTFAGDAVAPPPERTREAEDVLREHREIAADGRPYALFALRPELPGATEARPRDYVVVVDASQSMFGERYERATRLVRGMVAEMDRRDRVTAMACDAMGCRTLAGELQTPGTHAAEQIVELLEKEPPAGASDLAFALREAVAHAERLNAGGERELELVYVGDGLASVGPRRASTLSAEASSVLSGRAHLTTVGIGQDADAVVLASLARVGGGSYVPFVPGQSTGQAALAVLEATYGARLEKVQLELPSGVVDVAPRELPSIRAGQELMVAARLDGEDVRGEVVLRGVVAGRSFEQRYPVQLAISRSAGNAFVPRQWASKTIEALELAGRGADVPRIVALSKGFGVMSRHTSLLVLESEAMFRAFGVDRARPAVQWTGEDAMEYGESEGLNEVAGGNLGTLGALSGASASGYGRGAGGLSTRSAPAAMPMPAAPRRSVASARAEESALNDVMVEQVERRQRTASRRPPPRGGFWMKKVWFREGNVSRTSEIRERDLSAVRTAEERLRAEPNSRDRHRELVRALSRAGELTRAEEIARAWMSRDRLDVEALTYLSDVVGRQGRRAEALRLLSGTVDLEPDQARLQERLAAAFERSGDAMRACAHRVALAESDPDETDAMAAAMRCERGLGHSAAADRLLELAPTEARSRIVSAADRSPTPSRVTGDLMLEATWSGPDVDLTLVTPEGTRLSWMGGRTNVVGEDGTRRGSERLGLRRAGTGSYYVEVNRVDGDTTPVRGSITVNVLGQRQNLPFELTGDRIAVGRIEVVRRFRMERQNGPGPGLSPFDL
ncbi:MAG: FecR domain-containing protein [Polyangiales bacterium]